jgi:hypothetical protein
MSTSLSGPAVPRAEEPKTSSSAIPYRSQISGHDDADREHQTGE